jgi:hypothetical protein
VEVWVEEAWEDESAGTQRELNENDAARAHRRLRLPPARSRPGLDLVLLPQT